MKHVSACFGCEDRKMNTSEKKKPVLKTRLTQRLEISHPVISAPMAFAAGGALAAAVSQAGGLGLIGGGYGDAEWLENQFRAANNQPVGAGIITWSLSNNPDLLDLILQRAPKAVFLSFGDPGPFAAQILSADVALICQVQTLRDAKHAIDIGADIVVAQGAEAGGHGEKRGTMSLVAEVADYIAKSAPDVLLCAAGGIADGRGLAASLMLGADGCLVGSRFLASNEALVHQNVKNAVAAATGDITLQSSVTDIVRQKVWPDRYKLRVLKNQFTDRWHGHEAELRKNTAEHENWVKGWEQGDTEASSVVIGEAAGLISSVAPAADILNDMVEHAADLLAKSRLYLA
jgi:nitronate monooxygenase